MSNFYNMYPESSLWMSRTYRDAQEHRSAEHGGLGHASDYGTEFDTTAAEEAKREQTQRPVSAAVADLVMRTTTLSVEV